MGPKPNMESVPDTLISDNIGVIASEFPLDF
jgi:hypothetical protein